MPGIQGRAVDRWSRAHAGDLIRQDTVVEVQQHLAQVLVRLLLVTPGISSLAGLIAWGQGGTEETDIS